MLVRACSKLDFFLGERQDATRVQRFLSNCLLALAAVDGLIEILIDKPVSTHETVVDRIDGFLVAAVWNFDVGPHVLQRL